MNPNPHKSKDAILGFAQRWCPPHCTDQFISDFNILLKVILDEWMELREQYRDMLKREDAERKEVVQ